MYKFWSDKNKEKCGKNTKSILQRLFISKDVEKTFDT